MCHSCALLVSILLFILKAFYAVFFVLLGESHYWHCNILEVSLIYLQCTSPKNHYLKVSSMYSFWAHLSQSSFSITFAILSKKLQFHVNYKKGKVIYKNKNKVTSFLIIFNFHHLAILEISSSLIKITWTFSLWNSRLTLTKSEFTLYPFSLFSVKWL